MKWLKITVVFFLITLVKSGPTRSEEEPNPEPEPEPEPESEPEAEPEPGDKLEILEILRNSVSDFKCTLSDSIPGTPVRVNLVIKIPGKQSDIDATDITSMKTFTFPDDLKSKAVAPDVSFLLTASDDSPIPLAYAEHHFTKFPEFQDPPLTATRLEDPRNLNTGVILRVEGSLGSFILNKAGTLITGKDNIHYYQETSPDYTPCTEVEGVTIYDIKLNPTDLTATTLHDDILKSAVLSYGPDTGPDTKATLKLLPIAESPDILDAILIPIPTPTNGNNLCQIKEITGSACTIEWTEPSEDSLQVVLVQKTTEVRAGTETWTTTYIDIHDRQLVVNQLGDNIIEGRWLVLKGESTYRMKMNGDDKVGLDDIEVDCSHLTIEPKLCFGYFSELTTGTYTLTVAYKKDGTANEKDQIESSPVTITSLETELAILSRHTTRHANQLMADVNICFEHLTPTEGRSFSHYEMLIINEKGQWLKHRIMEEEEEEREGRLCFTPFAINTKDFDLTEGTRVVVSQRGVDGFTVLATGESKLL